MKLNWPRLVFPPINLYNYSKNELLSPCVKKCSLVGDSCIGCKRTVKEIQDWSLMGRQEQILLLLELKDRK